MKTSHKFLAAPIITICFRRVVFMNFLLAVDYSSVVVVFGSRFKTRHNSIPCISRQIELLMCLNLLLENVLNTYSVD